MVSKGKLLLLSAVLFLTGCEKSKPDSEQEGIPTNIPTEYDSKLDLEVVNSLSNMQFPVMQADLDKIEVYNPDDMDDYLWKDSSQKYYFCNSDVDSFYNTEYTDEHGIMFTYYDDKHPFKTCTFDKPTCICNGSRCVYTDSINFLYEAYNDVNIVNAKALLNAKDFVCEIDDFSKYTEKAEVNGEFYSSETNGEIVLWCPVKFQIKSERRSSSGLVPGVFYLRQTNTTQYIYIATIQSLLEPSEDDYKYLVSKLSFDKGSSEILSQGEPYNVEINLRGAYPMQMTCPESVHIKEGSYTSFYGNVSYNSGILMRGSAVYLYGEANDISTDEYVDDYFSGMATFNSAEKEIFENVDGNGTEITKYTMPASENVYNTENPSFSHSDGMRYIYFIRNNRYIYYFFVDTLYDIAEEEIDAMFKSVVIHTDPGYEDTQLTYREDYDLYVEYLIKSDTCSDVLDARAHIYTIFTGIEDPMAHRPPASQSTSWDNPWYTSDELFLAHNGLFEEEEIQQGIETPPYDENVDGPPAWNAAWEKEQQELEEQEELNNMEEIDDSYYENQE